VGYIDVSIDTEPVSLAGEAFDYLEAKVPGWLPSPGNLESWLIESLAQIAGELRTLVGLVPEDIFQFYGQTIMGLPPYGAVAATGSTTWTAIDTAGYTVTAGTLVAVRPPASSDAYGFEVVSDFTIPAGTLSMAGVQIVAVQPGAAASGITGTVEMIDVLDFINSVVLNAPTSGGQDAETADAYLDRLSDLMTLLAPRPILPNDFSLMAQRLVPGVARAVAIDLYKADTGTPNTPRCVTVVAIDANGEPVSTAIKNQIDTLLQGEREINFLVYEADPTYTTINVVTTFVVYAQYDPAEVGPRVVAALQSYLSPANWGRPPFGDTGTQSWINTTVVRYLEVAEAVNRVDGVNYIKTLTVQGGTVDVNLTGIAPLTRAGTITATGSLT
jgi:uncharacterized phage protein gp47/JayE